MSDLVFRLGGFPQRGLASAQGDKSSIRGDVRKAYLHPLKGLRNNAAPLALARMVPDGEDHPSVLPLRKLAAWIEAYEGPAAIVWGDKDPVLGRLKRRTQRSLPQAKSWETPAGHFLQEEVPGEIAEAIRYVAAQC